MEWTTLLLTGMAICGVLGALIGGSKGGRAVEGLLLGALFGPLGLLLAAILPPVKKNQKFFPIERSHGSEWQPGSGGIPDGIKLRCPNCGQEGVVPKLEDGAQNTCPTCKKKFDPQQNQVPS